VALLFWAKESRIWEQKMATLICLMREGFAIWWIVYIPLFAPPTRVLI